MADNNLNHTKYEPSISISHLPASTKKGVISLCFGWASPKCRSMLTNNLPPPPTLNYASFSDRYTYSAPNVKSPSIEPKIWHKFKIWLLKVGRNHNLSLLEIDKNQYLSRFECKTFIKIFWHHKCGHKRTDLICATVDSANFAN